MPKCPSVHVPWVPECPSVLSARGPESLKCPSALRAPSKCPSILRVLKCSLSAQVSTECLNTRLPYESPRSAQRSFRLVLTLTLNEKHFSEMRFKEIIIKFQVIQWFILLCACIISFRVEKNIKIFIKYFVRFSGRKRSWILKY